MTREDNSWNYFVRLIAEKINKNERKNKAEIHMEFQDKETILFWRALGEEPKMPIFVSCISFCIIKMF